MDVRLVQLLGSFITARSEYVLLRLEFAAAHPDLPAPPSIDRLPDASEKTLRERWPFAVSDLSAVRAFLDEHAPNENESPLQHETRRRFSRLVGELERYAHAITWVCTVEARGGEPGDD
ncbi:MAG TPA: hypothetical protein VMV73_02895 [Candidatus Dormibacteraeota bacterium]|nr:hypothetical protein [Candidatus Dormibacteraeota bacterium]